MCPLSTQRCAVYMLLASGALFYTGFVKVKMLPFDNKSEFQVIVDMPTGTAVPPGPPVLETLVAEVYGPVMDRRIELARHIRDLFKQTKGVVDVDWYVEDDQTKYRLLVDKEKAALNGISEDDIARAMQVAST